MGIATYNRGSRLIAQHAERDLGPALVRADRDAERAEAIRLRERCAALERELSRARRCIAELRRSKEERLSEARAEQARSDAAIRVLTRIAFSTEAP